MKAIVDYILDEDYPRYKELVEKAKANKAAAPRKKVERKPLTKEQQMERIKARMAKEEAKLAALLGQAE